MDQSHQKTVTPNVNTSNILNTIYTEADNSTVHRHVRNENLPFVQSEINKRINYKSNCQWGSLSNRTFNLTQIYICSNPISM